ncbi:hypothetical protein IVB18_20305 [Bradyrhizobium sp. 186]|uniref:hypothetical protein n=1 Tax=Bradyrhizobium sp. 186 TaxID=2782654 RepID=UPI002000C4A6|nr:hypothetical protein [Bradyrhizobium sp. 186]UPK39357.1 hypothetical protein IVB18_20305 [Bradyrhizobium sp. 186]
MSEIRNGTAPIPTPKPEPAEVAVSEPAATIRPPHVSPTMVSDPRFQVIDRSAEARTIEIEVQRL